MSATTEKERYLVFISHASKDKWIAKQMLKEIEAKGRRFGVATFLDAKDVAGGESIHEAIRVGIEACQEFLVLLTPNSILRPWILIELGAAWGQRKQIIAITHGVTIQDIPDILFPFKAIALDDFEDYLAEMIQRAKGAKNA